MSESDNATQSEPKEGAPQAPPSEAPAPGKFAHLHAKLKPVVDKIAAKVRAKFSKPDAAGSPARARKRSGLFGFVFEWWDALRHGNARSRRMAFFFLAFSVGSGLSFAYGVRAYLEYRKGARSENASGAQMAAFVEKQSEEARIKQSMLSLGTFTVQMIPPEGKKIRGVQNMGELDLVVECDQKNTRDYLEGRAPQIKDVLSAALRPQDRELILTVEGKEALKRSIMQGLNDALEQWLPGQNARVVRVFIQRMVIN